MRNIELKAYLRDRKKALAICRDLGATFQGVIHQKDTYFPVKEGRLKLRESDPGDDYLVFYRRPDVAGPKGCDYLILTIDRSVRSLLCEALGTCAVVEKTRTLFLWHNVRIHLDRVIRLGEFIEFEAVLSDAFDDQDGTSKLEHLQDAFGIVPADLIENSYLELVLGKQTGPCPSVSVHEGQE